MKIYNIDNASKYNNSFEELMGTIKRWPGCALIASKCINKLTSCINNSCILHKRVYKFSRNINEKNQSRLI